MRINRSEEERQRRRDILTATYVSDRSLNASSALLALAIITAALAYLIAIGSYALPLWASHSTSEMPVAVQLALPLPVLALFGFFGISWTDTLIRGQIIGEVEQELREDAFIPARVQAPSNHRRTDALWRLHRYRLMQIIVFGSMAVVVVLTIAGMAVLIHESRPHTEGSYIISGAVFLVYLAAWVLGVWNLFPISENEMAKLGLPSTNSTKE